MLSATRGVHYWRELVTSFLCSKTEIKTGIICILFVKWTIPSSPFSCCKETMTAAPAMNPSRVAFERKSMMNPNLHVIKCLH